MTPKEYDILVEIISEMTFEIRIRELVMFEKSYPYLMKYINLN